MNAPVGRLDGERLMPMQADALYNALPGIMIYADPIAEAFPELVAADPDADMVTADSVVRQQGNRARWPGIRDPLGEHHPVAVKLRRALEERPDAIPEPEPAIVTALVALGCVQVACVVSYRGVPVPAGAEQIAYFVVLRFRPLFSPLADPARIYRGNKAYDAANVTDEMQESILLVSTRIHRDNLSVLQQTAPDLFLAIWMREAEAAEQLTASTPCPKLPPCYPRSRLTDPRKCLMIVCDVMGEHERAFEFCHELRFIGGVTRTSVRAALAASSCMTEIYAVADDTHRHVAGGVAHTRSVHPTMNDTAPEPGSNATFEATRAAFDSSKVYADRYRHVIWIAGDMPVRFFLGVEPSMLIPVALIQMRETVVGHEGEFWLGRRGKQDLYKGLLATRLMTLAVIITSNICLPTAKAMTHDDGMLLPTAWLRQNVAPRVRNPKLEDELAEAASTQDDHELHDSATTKVPRPTKAVGDSDDFKNSYDGAKHRAKLCSAAIGEPGWTRGFRPDAWRQPLAEVEFLRDCCRYTRFNPKYVPVREQWNRVAAASGPIVGQQKTVVDVRTGLPRQHLKERVEDLFRRWFDPLQVAEGVKGREQSDAWLRREAFIREIAPLLPALIAITDDPYLNERFWIDRKSARVRIAVQGAWNV